MSHISLIREGRVDDDAKSVASDLLLSCGYPDERVRRALRPYTPLATRLAAEEVGKHLERRLVIVNARNRSRLIGLNHVLGAIGEAIYHGFGWRNGGWPTASSYGYRWTTSCVTAVRDDGVDGVVAPGVGKPFQAAPVVRVILGRYDGRSAAWGIGGMTDRATRHETIERIREAAAERSRADFDLAFSVDVARCLVLVAEGV